MLRLDWNLAITVLNLLVWYAILRHFLFKPVNNIINKREELIRSRYEDAKKLQDEAQAEKEKYAAFQAGIETEKAKMMEDAQAQAGAEYERILADARERADQIVAASQKEAELEKEKIIGKAEQEIRSMIMDTAVKSMQSSSDDSALYDQFLTRAGETNHAEH